MAGWHYGMRLAIFAAVTSTPLSGLAQDSAPNVKIAQAVAPDKPLEKEPTPDTGPAAAATVPENATRASSAESHDLSVDEMISALGALNITYSVAEASLREWLANADYTPYPAVTTELIALLHGRRLANPLDLDVIIFDYENTPGIQSPRKTGDVNQDALIAAVLKGYNARHSTSAHALPEITGTGP